MIRPSRIAIVGTGPSGMYALEHLLHNKLVDVEVDLFERLPVPWGLVRYGVAPDHPEKKLIANRLYNNLISRDNVRFFGNVEIGKEISHNDLSQWYDGVIYASGASADNKLGIAGEELTGSWSAREFVAWYNGHPDYRHLQFDFSNERAVIVGNGNVAMDVARILLLPLEALKQTDIASHALDALSQNKVKEVVILGRRGYQAGAYNNPELEELLHLDNVNVSVEDPAFEHATDPAILSEFDWQTQRKITTLQQLVAKSSGANSKRIVFKFLSSPIEITGSNKVEQLIISQNDSESGETKKTSNNITIDCGLIFRAIGYRGQAFPGLPFDNKRHVIENDKGRICDNGKTLTGAYVTGWIKRGPKGVIGTNKQCAAETVACLMEDLSTIQNNKHKTLNKEESLNQINRLIKNYVSYEGWLKIDRAEKQNGINQQRPRLKFCDTGDMLNAANARLR